MAELPNQVDDNLPIIDIQDISFPVRDVLNFDLCVIRDPLSIVAAYHKACLEHAIAQGANPVELEDRHVEWLAYWTTTLTTQLDVIMSDLARSTPYNG